MGYKHTKSTLRIWDLCPLPACKVGDPRSVELILVRDACLHALNASNVNGNMFNIKKYDKKYISTISKTSTTYRNNPTTY